jgi:LPS export ABC transporter protein LptC
MRVNPKLCIVIVLAAGAAACGSQTTTPSAVTDAEGLPADNVILGVEHNMTNEGIRTGVLHSDTAFLYESSRRMDLRGVRIQFYGDTGVETGTLTSTTGEYDVGTGSFVARGDVVLITDGPDGERRLETEELHYDVERDRLWSDVPFVMREGGAITRGTSFRSDSQFRTWSVTGAETEGGIPQGRSGVSF